jgi:hypothetical protein
VSKQRNSRLFTCLILIFFNCICSITLAANYTISCWEDLNINNGITVIENDIRFSAGTYTFLNEIVLRHTEDVYWNFLGADLDSDGNPTTLFNANNLCWFFYAACGNIERIAWINGNGLYGGAIYVESAFTGDIVNSTFASNASERVGGAICVCGAFTGDIINSTFTGNSAAGHGGAILFLDGGFNGNIVNSTFTSNTAEYYGGAIFICNGFNGNIIDSTFAGNSSGYDGGAMLAEEWFDGIVVNSTFAGNISRQDGGAICAYADMWRTAGQFTFLATNNSSYGDVLFLHNIAGRSGAAIFIEMSANIYAAFGDMIFQGNRDRVDFDDETTAVAGNANAIYFDNYYNESTIAISAFDNYMVRFYDPIRSSEERTELAVRINDALGETTDEEESDISLGELAVRQTGTVLFDTHRSDAYFASEYGAQVCRGTMALHNGASFGALGNDGKFTLNAGATLRIAYEQEKREYVLNEDKTFTRDDPSKIIKTFPKYKDECDISSINACALYLNGAVHFVIPSNANNNDVLFATPGSVTFGGTASIALSVPDNGLVLQKDDRIILIQSNEPMTGFPNNVSTTITGKKPIGLGVEELTNYTFNISANTNNLMAVLTNIDKLQSVSISPASQAFTNAHLASLCIAKHGADIASSLADMANSSFGRTDGCSLRWMPFIVPISVDRSTYKTGASASAQTRELSFVGGLLTDVQLSNGQLRFGQFFEFGEDKFLCSNELQPAGGISKISSKGCSQLYVAGAFMRFDFCGTPSCGRYCEGSCRIGSLSSTFGSSDINNIFDGNSDYEMSNLFCGGHLAIGCTLRSRSAASVNFYGKCIWAHRNCGESTVNSSDTIKFSAIDSVRAQIGARVSCAICKNFSVCASTTFEQELDGKSSATLCGNAISASNFNRNSAIGSLQMTWKPLSAKQVAIDIALHGSIGAREGVRGSLQASLAL